MRSTPSRSAKKADIAEFNAMLKTARERVEKLFNEGKSEADVIAARPLKDLGAKWTASDTLDQEVTAQFVRVGQNHLTRQAAVKSIAEADAPCSVLQFHAIGTFVPI